MLRWTRFGQMGAEGSGEEATVDLHGRAVMLIRIERRPSPASFRVLPAPNFRLFVYLGSEVNDDKVFHESAQDTMREAKQAGKARTLEMLDKMAKFVRGELYGPGRVK